MADFVTLTCPSCGGKLHISSETERIACEYCGNEHLVQRGEGIISLTPISDAVRGIRRGVDKAASELAIKRIQEELPLLRQSKQKVQRELSNTINQLADLKMKKAYERNRNLYLSVLFIIPLIAGFIYLLSVGTSFYGSDLFSCLAALAFLIWVGTSFLLGHYQSVINKLPKMSIGRLIDVKSQLDA
jgi:cation transport ATPase